MIRKSPRTMLVRTICGNVGGVDPLPWRITCEDMDESRMVALVLRVLDADPSASITWER